MKVKILEDFVYSLDGIKPTSFKKGDVVSDFNAKEVQKLTKSGKVGPEKTKVSRQDPPPTSDGDSGNKNSDENSDNKNSDEDSKDDKDQNPNLPAKPQATRDDKDKTGN